MWSRTVFVISAILLQLNSYQCRSIVENETKGPEETTSRSTEIVNQETTTEARPQFQFLVDPNEYYDVLIGHLGDKPHAKVLAYQMIDATSKMGSGIFDGKYIDYGSPEECYKINEDGVYGKYCVGIKMLDGYMESIADDYHSNISELSKEYRTFTNKFVRVYGIPFLPYRLGVCMPYDMNPMEVPTDAMFMPELCTSNQNQPEVTTAALLTGSIMGLIFLIALASTIYEIVLHYKQQKPLHWSLVSFSYFTNGRNFMKSGQSKNELVIPCIYGVKVLSMLWVVYGHFAVAELISFDNLINIIDGPFNMWFDMIFGGQFAVETFLMIGGFIVTFSSLTAMSKGRKFQIIPFYLYRYLRMVPLYAAVIFVCRDLLPYMGSGPYWFVISRGLVQPCKDGWWSNLLFLGNYLHKEVCVAPSYYLHIDMQLYFLTPLILIPLFKWPKYAVKALIAFALVTPAIIFYIAWDLKASHYNGNLNTMKNFTIVTHVRYASYLNGIVLGYVFYKYQASIKKITLNKATSIALWILCVFLFILTIYCGHDTINGYSPTVDHVGAAIHTALTRPLWCMAIALLLFLCYSGHGGPVNVFLSAPIFEIGSRLTYAMFLVHVNVTMVYGASSYTYQEGNFKRMFYPYWGIVVVTTAISAFAALTYEIPFSKIQTALLQGLIKRAPKKPDADAPTKDLAEPE